jgi:hypothetical protein
VEKHIAMSLSASAFQVYRPAVERGLPTGEEKKGGVDPPPGGHSRFLDIRFRPAIRQARTLKNNRLPGYSQRGAYELNDRITEPISEQRNNNATATKDQYDGDNDDDGRVAFLRRSISCRFHGLFLLTSIPRERVPLFYMNSGIPYVRHP